MKPATPQAPPQPVPRSPRHQRFADLVLRGETLASAYRKAGFRGGSQTAQANGKRLRKRPDIQRYIRHMQAGMVQETQLAIREILILCARVVRTGINEIDPETGANADLVKSWAISRSECSKSKRIEKLDPYKAIEIHLRITGADQGDNALSVIASAIASLGTVSPLPTDKL